jgi:hypothetical protein
MTISCSNELLFILDILPQVVTFAYSISQLLPDRV